MAHTTAQQEQEQEQQELLQKLNDPFWRLQHLYHIKREDNGQIQQRSLCMARHVS
jgi:hypothetical protein